MITPDRRTWSVGALSSLDRLADLSSDPVGKFKSPNDLNPPPTGSEEP